jgi:hypothetical protein
MRRIPRALANVALMFASVTAAAAAIEAGARFWVRRAPGALFVADSVEPDPVRGWRHRPGAAGSYGRASWRINARGLRDVDRAPEVPPGATRALVLGDSFAEGFSVGFESCVSRVLERELRAAGCAAEVVNGGTVGYSTDQEYLFYRDEGAAYGARVVVLLFYYNDILYNARGAAPGGVAKPLFTFAGGMPRVKNYPLPAPPPRETRSPRWWRGSAALTWARERLRERAPGVYDSLARVRFWSRLDRELPLEMAAYLREPPEPMRQAWLQTEHLLGLLRGEVERHGATLLVAHVPSKIEVDRDAWDQLRRRYDVDEREWDRRAVVRRLEDAGRRKGIAVADLSEALWREHGRGGAYFRGGGHWNEAGHAAAAHEIARRLLEARSLGCPAP